MSFSILPHKTTIDVQPFRVEVDQHQLEHLQKLLELSPVSIETFENTHTNQLGLSRSWLVEARDYWLNKYDWRKHEARINSFPNFKSMVTDKDGNDIDIHFLALFSQRADAQAIMLLHGWPGSALEFIRLLDLLRSKYTAQELPYHIIVPSLPGYGFSSIPKTIPYSVELAASALDNLMVGLGFDSYISQGGDLGSFISRILAQSSKSCIGIHLNMMGINPTGPLLKEGFDGVEKAATKLDTGFAFLPLQATRPATVGHLLSSSPLALLAWIGEKYLEWMDSKPSLDRILEIVTLYWFTNTAARCMYHNRTLIPPPPEKRDGVTTLELKLAPLRLPYVAKPCGYSLFAHEILPIPENWAKLSCNLISFSKHERGGHFAALEQPDELLADIEEYVKALKVLHK